MPSCADESDASDARPAVQGALTRLDGVLLGLLCAAAAIVRNPAVAGWDSLVFDEEYYVKDALRYLGRLPGGEVSWVHPPLGKWLTAAGIVVGGDNPLGWRTAAYVAGVLTVALTFLIGRHLHSRTVGALAGLFVVFDGLLVVHSRTGMLDGLLPPLVLGAVLVALPALAPHGEASSRPAERSWSRLASAGALLGAGVAVKWSVAPVLVAFLAVVVVRMPLRTPKAWANLGVSLVLLPAAVYLATFVRFWSSDGTSPAAFIRLHRGMVDYHDGLEDTHAYGSDASSWLWLRRPVSYAYEAEGDQVREILAVGNPVLWWAFLVVLPVLVVAWYRRRTSLTAVVLLAVLALYLPWLAAPRQGFLFYLTPLVPFMAIGVAWAAVEVWRSDRVWRWFAPLVPLAVVGAGLLYLPLWIGSTVSRGRWDSLMLFDSWI